MPAIAGLMQEKVNECGFSAGSVHCAHNKRVEADAVKRRAVSCYLGGRAAHARR